MAKEAVQLIQGTLELLILRALEGTEPRHGFDILRWILAASEGALSIEEGALYPALHRMERRGWLTGEWGLSENNRRAKYYTLTRAGRARLTDEVAGWHTYVRTLARVLEGPKSERAT